MSNQIVSELLVKLRTDVSEITKAIPDIQNKLNTLKPSDGFKKGFSKGIDELYDEITNFTSKASKEISSMADASALEKSGKKVLDLYEDLHRKIESTKELSTSELLKLFPQALSEDLKNTINELKRYEKEHKNALDSIQVETQFLNQKNKELKKLQETQKNLTSLQQKASSLESARQKKATMEGDIKEKIRTGELKGSEKKGLDNRFTVNKKILAELQAAQAEVEQLEAEYEELKKSFEKDIPETGLEQGIEDIGKEISETEKNIKSFQKNIERIKAGDDKGFAALKLQLEQLTNLNFDSLENGEAGLKTIQETLNGLEVGQLEAFRQKLSELDEEILKNHPLLKELKSGFEGVKTSVKELTAAQKELENFKNNVLQFFSIGNTVQLFKRAVSSAIDTIKELDAAMTEIAVVSDYDISDMWDKLPEFTSMANEMGVSIKEAYAATTLYIQQGLNFNDSLALSTETLKMARIAGLSAADATDAMTAAMRGFNMEINEMSAQRINDVYSQLAAITASNVAEISNAMSKTASIASNANMEFETTAAFLSQIIETTRESAETAGTAMKTVIARFQELKKDPSEIGEVDGEIVDANKIETALRTIGVSLRDAQGQFRDLDDVFLEIAQKWDGLDTNTQRYIATMAAGSRQQSRFIAMMSNYDRTMELVEAANNSAGASQEQFDKTLQSLQTSLTNLSNAWQEFTMGIANSALVKFLVDGLTSIITLVNKVTDSFGSMGGAIAKIAIAFAGLQGAKAIINNLFTSLIGNTFKGPLGKRLIGGATEVGTGAGLGFGKSFANALKASGTATVNAAKWVGNKVRPTIEKHFKKPIDILIKINDKHTKKEAERTKQTIENSLNKITFENEQDKQDILNLIGKGDIDQANQKLNGLGYTIDNVTGKVVKLGNEGEAGMQQVAGGAMAIGGALVLVGNLFADLGLEKVGSTITTIGTALIAFGTIMSVLIPLQAHLMAKEVSAAIYGIPIIGWIAGIISALIALISIIDIWHESEKEKAERLKKSLAAAEEAAQAAKEAYDDMKSAFDDYDKMQDALDQLVVGTEEWTEKLEEANDQVMELLKTYPDLIDYVKTDAYGRMTITEEGQRVLLEEQKRAANRADMGVLGQKAMVLLHNEQGLSNSQIRGQMKGLMMSGLNAGASDELSKDKYAADIKTLFSTHMDPEDYQEAYVEAAVGYKNDSEEDLKREYLERTGLTELPQSIADLGKQGLVDALANMDVMEDAADDMNRFYKRFSKLNQDQQEAFIKTVKKDGKALDKKLVDAFSKYNGKEIGLKEQKDIADEYFEQTGVKIQDAADAMGVSVSDFIKILLKNVEIAEQAFDSSKQILTSLGLDGDALTKLEESGLSANTLEGLTNKLFDMSFNVDANAARNMGEYISKLLEKSGEDADALANLLGDIDWQDLEEVENLGDIIRNLGLNSNLTEEEIEGLEAQLIELGKLSKEFSVDELREKMSTLTAIGEDIRSGEGDRFYSEEEKEALIDAGLKETDFMLTPTNEWLYTGTEDKLLGNIDKNVGSILALQIEKKRDSVNRGNYWKDWSGETYDSKKYSGPLEGESAFDIFERAAENMWNAIFPPMSESTNGNDVNTIRPDTEISAIVTPGSEALLEIKEYLSDQGYQYDNKDPLDLFNTLGEERTQAILELLGIKEYDFYKGLSEAGYGLDRLYGNPIDEWLWQYIGTGTEIEKGNQGKAAYDEKVGEDNRLTPEEIAKYLISGDLAIIDEDTPRDQRPDASAYINRGYMEELVKMFYEGMHGEGSSEGYTFDYLLEYFKKSYTEDWGEGGQVHHDNAEYLAAYESMQSDLSALTISLVPIAQGLTNLGTDLQKLVDDYGGENALVEAQAYFYKIDDSILRTYEAMKVWEPEKAAKYLAQAIVDKQNAQKLSGFSKDLYSIFEKYDNPLELSDEDIKQIGYIFGINEMDDEDNFKFIKNNLTNIVKLLKGEQGLTKEMKDKLLEDSGLTTNEYGTIIAAGERYDSQRLNQLVSMGFLTLQSDAGYKNGEYLVDPNNPSAAPVQAEGDGAQALGYTWTPPNIFEMAFGLLGIDFNPSQQTAENTLDKEHNLIQKINAAMRERERLERQYQRLLEEEGLSGRDLQKITEQQVQNLEDQISMQEKLIERKQAELEIMIANNKTKGYDDYFWYDEETRTIQIDHGNFESLENNPELFDKVTAAMDEMQGVIDQIDDSTSSIEDIKDDVTKIRNRGKDSYVDLESRILDALIRREEMKIEEQEKIVDAIDEAANDLMDAVSKNIDKIRRDRDNEKTEQSIADKERRLAYLKQDTSGANDLEIKRLEKEIADEKENYQDTLIDQALQDLQDQNDVAAEQRQQQIEMMRSQLKYEEETGYYVGEAQRILKEALENGGIFDTNSEFYHLLSHTEGWGTLATSALLEKIDEVRRALAEAFDYVNNGTDQVYDIDTTDFKAEIAKVIAQYMAGEIDYEAALSKIQDLETLRDIKIGQLSAEEKAKIEAQTGEPLEKTDGTIAGDFKENYGPHGKNGPDYQALINQAIADHAAGKIGTQEAYEKIARYEDFRDDKIDQLTAEEKAKIEAETGKPLEKTNGTQAKKFLDEAEKGKGVATGSFGANDRGKLSNDKMNKEVYNGTQSEIMQLQEGLNDLITDGVLDMPELLDVDGIYGKYTTTAVGKLQELIGATQDGLWGPITYELFKKSKYKAYKKGGLVDFTGPAWLDGTKSRPEMVLSARDTENFIILKDLLANVIATPAVQPNPRNENYFDISVQVEEIADDYDVDQMVDRVKQKIYEDSMYRNVNSLGLLR